MNEFDTSGSRQVTPTLSGNYMEYVTTFDYREVPNCWTLNLRTSSSQHYNVKCQIRISSLDKMRMRSSSMLNKRCEILQRVRIKHISIIYQHLQYASVRISSIMRKIWNKIQHWLEIFNGNALTKALQALTFVRLSSSASASACSSFRLRWLSIKEGLPPSNAIITFVRLVTCWSLCEEIKTDYLWHDIWLRSIKWKVYYLRKVEKKFEFNFRQIKNLLQNKIIFKHLKANTQKMWVNPANRIIFVDETQSWKQSNVENQ